MKLWSESNGVEEENTYSKSEPPRFVEALTPYTLPGLRQYEVSARSYTAVQPSGFRISPHEVRRA